MVRSLAARVLAAWVLCLIPAVISCAYLETETVTTTGSQGTTPLTAEAVAAVREGVTTRQSVIDLFGPPAEVRRLDDGGEVLSYLSETTVVRRKHIPLIWTSKTSTAHSDRFSFEIKDGVVSRLWFETSP